jgi:hypothetical protein
MLMGIKLIGATTMRLAENRRAGTVSVGRKQDRGVAVQTDEMGI